MMGGHRRLATPPGQAYAPEMSEADDEMVA